jgi:tRNA threonylcarbamoyladenosine modification (KEOPS) complex Cgi121 subunit
MTEIIYVGIDDKRLELKGSELESFLQKREQTKLQEMKTHAEIEEQKLAKASALAKLAALGLTDAEVAALIS